MQAYYGTRLSEHMSTTPEGFLVCHDAVLCRTAEHAPQMYRGSELRLRTDDTVRVFRPREEVTSKKFLASLESKPLTDQHPGQFLNPDNVGWYIRGHVRNVKVGHRLDNGETAIVGDIVVHDAALIHKIQSGVRELSVGYSCEYEPRGDGTYEQRKLRANHLALVTNGRAGDEVRILDSQCEPQEDFGAVAAQYRGQPNPANVAAARAAARTHRAQDSVTEEMRASGEPRPWHELAADLAARYNPRTEYDDEEIMPKKHALDEEGLAILKRIVREVIAEEFARREQLEEETSEEEEYEEAADASPALQKLRALRPLIEARGTREEKERYNTAVRTLKRQHKNLVEAADTFAALEAPAGDSAQSWENILKFYRRRNPKEGRSLAEAAQAARIRVTAHALDATGSSEGYADAVNRAGARMRGEPEPEPEEPTARHTEDATARSDDEAWGRSITRQFCGKEIKRR